MTNKSTTASFRPNDVVVYPAHGVGRIISIENATAAKVLFECYVIAFERLKLTVRVPLKGSGAKALRPLANKANLKTMAHALNGKRRTDKRIWSTRAKAYNEKIHSGNLVRIAEVVRDLHKGPNDATEQSYSERILYREALDRLLEETAYVLSVTTVEAAAYLTEQCLESKRVFTLDYVPPQVPLVKERWRPPKLDTHYTREYVRDRRKNKT